MMRAAVIAVLLALADCGSPASQLVMPPPEFDRQFDGQLIEHETTVAQRAASATGCSTAGLENHAVTFGSLTETPRPFRCDGSRSLIAMAGRRATAM